MAERFEEYCERMASPAAWGSQLELGALAQTLQRRIEVYAAHLPPITMGEEHKGASEEPAVQPVRSGAYRAKGRC